MLKRMQSCKNGRKKSDDNIPNTLVGTAFGMEVEVQKSELVKRRSQTFDGEGVTKKKGERDF
jgi:hypothetical protein